MDLSEPFQIKFLAHLSPCPAALVLCANISKFICGFYLLGKKNPCFSSSHLNHLDLPHHFFYLINISCFSAKREQDITVNVQTQILEIYSSDTQNIIVLLFSILKLCLLEQLHYYFCFILHFYKYILHFKGKERSVIETVFIK